MKWVEAIGAPGVGKTFLIRRLIAISRDYDLERKWITQEESIEPAFRKISINNLHTFYQFLLWLYGRQKLFYFKKKGAKAVLVKKIYQPKGYIKTSNWIPFFEVHKAGVGKSTYSPITKGILRNEFLGLLEKYQFYDAIDLDQAVFMEEGLFQNSYGSVSANLKLRNGGIFPVIIYYRGNVDLIFKRVKKKETETGKRCAWYHGLNDDALKTKIAEIIELQDENIFNIKNGGIPVVTTTADAVISDSGLIKLLQEINQNL